MRNDLDTKKEGAANDTNQNLFTSEESMHFKSGKKPLMKDKEVNMTPIKEEDNIKKIESEF